MIENYFTFVKIREVHDGKYSLPMFVTSKTLYALFHTDPTDLSDSPDPADPAPGLYHLPYITSG